MTETKKVESQFYGLSTLRAKEKEQQPQSEHAKAMADYLKKYTSGGDEPKKKRRKKVVPKKGGTNIVDEDASGFYTAPQRKIPSNLDEAEGSGNDSDGPVIANPGEAELYKRQQAKEKSGAAYQGWSRADEIKEKEVKRMAQRRARHDSSDESPPRRNISDVSPPRRKQRHDSPDESPPRRKQRHDSPDESPPRRKQRHDSPDESPPRRKQRHDSPDESPPRRRKQRHDSPDESPPRRKPKSDDESPPRRGKRESLDASPPRRKPQEHGERHPKEKTGKMNDGTSAGLISGKDYGKEMKVTLAAEQERLKDFEARTGSKKAQVTQYRDKLTGKLLTKEEMEESQRKAKEKNRPKFETPEWGGGLRQKQERQDRADEMRKQASKPFARNLDDVDQDLNLKDRARFGDPMAHLVRKKAEAPPPPAVPENMAKLLKKGGFAIPQEVPSHSWLRRKMGPPPNRYGIKPGRHWDGVDRSNGFERDMFREINARSAREREARAWAQSDM